MESRTWEKGKVQYLLQSFLHETDLRPEVLCHLGSGSWLAWANDTAAQYAGSRVVQTNEVSKTFAKLQSLKHLNDNSGHTKYQHIFLPMNSTGSVSTHFIDNY